MRHHRGAVRTIKHAAVLLAPWLVLGACSSSPAVSSGSDAGGDAQRKKQHDAASMVDATGDATETGVVGSDAKPHVINDPQNCVPPGTTSNVDGVGGYCSPAGAQCLRAIAGGMASICTADVGAAAHEWFCTVPCATTTDCGAGGSTCIATVQGQVCVPAACMAFVGDASTYDSGFDSGKGLDGSMVHDAAHTDGAARDASREAAVDAHGD
jgi:hypothetical protein